MEPTYRVPHSSLQDGLSHSPAVRSSRPQSSGAGQGAKYPISPTINRTPPPTQFAMGGQEVGDTQFGRPSLHGWRRGCDKAAVTWQGTRELVGCISCLINACVGPPYSVFGYTRMVRLHPAAAGLSSSSHKSTLTLPLTCIRHLGHVRPHLTMAGETPGHEWPLNRLRLQQPEPFFNTEA